MVASHDGDIPRDRNVQASKDTQGILYNSAKVHNDYSLGTNNFKTTNNRNLIISYKVSLQITLSNCPLGEC
jgi:hypothetical protein